MYMRDGECVADMGRVSESAACLFATEEVPIYLNTLKHVSREVSFPLLLVVELCAVDVGICT
jgi:hypothetical protein